MTAPTDFVSERRVRQALDELLQRAEETGQRPSVLALARQFSMSNTTFRRHFPDITREIGQARSAAPADRSERTTSYDKLVARNARLKRVNSEQQAQLRLAAAEIQRLALLNAALLEDLEEARNVTPLRPRAR
ncbi:hypothetical protein [Streptomyces prasinus]|uniref:TetR family transcriptional regulator n=1 Tax=Streptomyces prasinus TaxID=67345 RepID=A0ABX6ASG8_9ACTN|nr:hypothetical protein [Streptomyces prasinus]QEV04929.1 hypothetical protein CP972_03755 [Streptomyces prasinus]